MSYFVCLFELRFNIPVNNFSIILGRSHRFLVINQYSGGVNVHCSMTQHVAAGGSNTGPLDSEFDALPLCHHAPQAILC